MKPARVMSAKRSREAGDMNLLRSCSAKRGKIAGGDEADTGRQRRFSGRRGAEQ